MSIRSRSGPDSRDRYAATVCPEQVHGRSVAPAYPHGQGFAAVTNMQRAGN